MKRNYVFQIGLPLKQSVIFVDWHGVLSDRLFWHSLLANPSHPLYGRVKVETERLFGSERDLVQTWMRGNLTSKDIITEFQLTLPKNYRSDFLHRELLRGCQEMSPNAVMLDTLQMYVNASWLVLATDNMDCFVESLPSISPVSEIFDHILCSAELGILKSDSVYDFFSPWLEAHSLDYAQAILIDDSETTCEEFRKAGGSAIHHICVRRTIEQLAQIQGCLAIQ